MPLASRKGMPTTVIIMVGVAVVTAAIILPVVDTARDEGKESLAGPSDDIKANKPSQKIDRTGFRTSQCWVEVYNKKDRKTGSAGTVGNKRSRRFDEGKGDLNQVGHNTPNTECPDNWARCISSLQLKQGCGVQLFSRPRFNGQSITIGYDQDGKLKDLHSIAGPGECGGDWGDCIQSFKLGTYVPDSATGGSTGGTGGTGTLQGASVSLDVPSSLYSASLPVKRSLKMDVGWSDSSVSPGDVTAKMYVAKPTSDDQIASILEESCQDEKCEKTTDFTLEESHFDSGQVGGAEVGGARIMGKVLYGGTVAAQDAAFICRDNKQGAAYDALIERMTAGRNDLGRMTAGRIDLGVKARWQGCADEVSFAFFIADENGDRAFDKSEDLWKGKLSCASQPCSASTSSVYITDKAFTNVGPDDTATVKVRITSDDDTVLAEAMEDIQR